MSAAAAPRLVNPVDEAHASARNRVRTMRDRTVQAGNRADAARHRRQEAHDRVQELRSDLPPIASMSRGNRVLMLMMPVFFLVIAGGDWLTTIPTADWLAELIGRTDWIQILRFSLPIAIIAADIVVAYCRYRATQEAMPGDRADTRLIFPWVLLAALMVLSLATRLTDEPNPEAPPHEVHSFWALTVGLVAVTSVLHSLVIFNGRLMVESLSLWVWVLSLFTARYRERQATADYSRHAGETLRLFSGYADERNAFVGQFHHAPADIFNDATRRVLRDQLEYDPFNEPQPAMRGTDMPLSGNSSTTPGAFAASPEPRGDSPVSNVDEDYYRRIVEERQRDQESEIQKEN